MKKTFATIGLVQRATQCRTLSLAVAQFLVCVPVIYAAQLSSHFELNSGKPFNLNSCKNLDDYGLASSLSEEDHSIFNDWRNFALKTANTSRRRRANFEAKQQEFCSGQRDWSKIGSDWAWDAFNLSVTTAASVGINKALKVPNTNVTGSLAEPASKLLGNSISTFRFSKRDLTEGLKKVHLVLQKESANRVQSLSEDMRYAIQSIDNRITTLLEQKNGDVAFKLLSRREEVYLALPTQALNVSHKNKGGNLKLRQIIDRRVHDLISRYPSDQQSTLKLLISSIRKNSIRSQGDRVQAYFYGPPGTGKTTFVELLGRTLGLPVCMINLSSLEMNELLGPYYADDYTSESNAKVAGKLTQCFIDAGYTNPIIFFDEAGEYLSDSTSSDNSYNNHKNQMIQGEFKKITDNSLQRFHHLGLKVDVDTSRATYLFASNFSLANSALLRRMMQITFPALTPEQKLSAADFAFKKVMCSQGDLYADSEAQAIKEISETYLPFILAEDERRNPGGSILQQVIQEFVIHVEGVLEDDTASVTDELLKKRIIDSFSLREAFK